MYLTVSLWFLTAQWEQLGLQALPPGLTVIEDTVSPDVEQLLLESINWTEDTDHQNCKENLKILISKNYILHFSKMSCYYSFSPSPLVL